MNDTCTITVLESTITKRSIQTLFPPSKHPYLQLLSAHFYQCDILQFKYHSFESFCKAIRFIKSNEKTLCILTNSWYLVWLGHVFSVIVLDENECKTLCVCDIVIYHGMILIGGILILYLRFSFIPYNRPCEWKVFEEITSSC